MKRWPGALIHHGSAWSVHDPRQESPNRLSLTGRRVSLDWLAGRREVLTRPPTHTAAIVATSFSRERFSRKVDAWTNDETGEEFSPSSTTRLLSVGSGRANGSLGRSVGRSTERLAGRPGGLTRYLQNYIPSLP